MSTATEPVGTDGLAPKARAALEAIRSFAGQKVSGAQIREATEGGIGRSYLSDSVLPELLSRGLIEAEGNTHTRRYWTPETGLGSVWGATVVSGSTATPAGKVRAAAQPVNERLVRLRIVDHLSPRRGETTRTRSRDLYSLASALDTPAAAVERIAAALVSEGLIRVIDGRYEAMA